jgi:hypothetical protein
MNREPLNVFCYIILIDFSANPPYLIEIDRYVTGRGFTLNSAYNGKHFIFTEIVMINSYRSLTVHYKFVIFKKMIKKGWVKWRTLKNENPGC